MLSIQEAEVQHRAPNSYDLCSRCKRNRLDNTVASLRQVSFLILAIRSPSILAYSGNDNNVSEVKAKAGTDNIVAIDLSVLRLNRGSLLMHEGSGQS